MSSHLFGTSKIHDYAVDSRAEAARQFLIAGVDLDKYKKIAVVGPNGDKTVFGDYSWSAPSAVAGVSLYERLKNRAGNAVEISFTQGCVWWSQDGSGIEDA